MAHSDTAVINKKKLKEVVKEPGKYKVIILNDDFTPVDFVIALLISVFNHSEELAMQVTMQVHHQGSGVAGIYTYEIAEQKTFEGTNLARNNGFPLVLKMVDA